MSVPSIEDLMKLRDITRMTGTLSNLQMLQLRLWPQVILGAQKAEIEFDPDAQVVSVDLSDLDYKTMMEDSPWQDPVKLYQYRMEKFDSAVKFLLGDDYGTVIRLKGTTIGQFGPRRMPAKAHEPDPEGLKTWKPPVSKKPTKASPRTSKKS